MPDPQTPPPPSRHPDPDSGDHRQPPDTDQPGRATSGDVGAADIVSPVGEEMPVQTHDEVDGVDETSRRHAKVNADR